MNANEKVLSAEALNADAETVLGDMDLKGVSLDVAVNAIIGAMLQAGYLDEARNSILVSVESGDAARGAALEQEVSAAIAAATQTDSLSAAVLSQTISATDETLTSLAAEYDISLGKAALIQEVVAQDATLTVADLAGVDINEIALLISSNNISTSTTQTGTASDKAYIGESAALNAALADAGVSNADVLRSTAKLGRENGVMVYEVEFDTAEMEYDYDIDAGTGAVVSVDIERRYSGLETVISSITSGTLIGETAAEDIALADAGASRTDVTYLNSWLEYDDGRMECYEVEFAVGSTVYEYKIGLYDGTIRSRDVETRGGTGASSGNTTQSTLIGEDAALSAALSHAGVSASDASKTKVKLDRDDGVYVYEVEFTVGWLEYEYEIDAASGSILSFEIDD